MPDILLRTGKNFIVDHSGISTISELGKIKGIRGKKLRKKLKGPWLWLCSSRQLLRGSQLRGRMYRHDPRCNYCFRSSKPQLLLAESVDFFGSGGFPGCPFWPITQSTSDRQLFNFANPFDRRRMQR